MPVNTADQQITLPIGADAADNPLAFTNFVADVEQRLVRLYTNEADRTARRASVAENELSALADVDRVEVYTGAADVSLYRRSLYAFLVKSASQILTQNNTTLQNVTDLVVAVPTAGSFSFRGVIYYDSSTTADIKFGFTFPAGGTLRWNGLGMVTTGTTTGDANFATVTGSGSAIAYGGAGVATVLACQIEGEYVAGGTAGNLQFQAAQNTGELTNSTINIRSRLEVWRYA